MSDSECALGPIQPWRAPGPKGALGAEGWNRPSPVMPYAIMEEDKAKYATRDGQASLADSARTAGVVDFSEVYFPAGLDTGYHINYNEDEAFYVLEGEVNFYAEGRNTVGTPNTFVFAPRGRPHQFVVTKHCRMLIIETPATTETFLMDGAPPVKRLHAVKFPPSPWPPIFPTVSKGNTSIPKWQKIYWGQAMAYTQHNIEILDHPAKMWNHPSSAWALQPEPPIQAPAPDRQLDVSKVKAYAATGEMRAKLLKAAKGMMFIGIPMANSLSTGGVMGLTEFVNSSPGSDSGYHINHNEDEVFFILSGEVTFHAEGTTVVGKPGTFVFAPRGRPHQYVVTGADGSDMLQFNWPGTFESIVQGNTILGIDRAAHYSLLNIEVIDHLPRIQKGPPWIVEPEDLRESR